MNRAEIVKSRLDSAIKDVVSQRGDYILDLNRKARHRKLTDADICRLLIGFSGGSLAKELRISRANVTTSALSQRRKGIPFRVFYAFWQRFNESCKEFMDKRYHGKYHLWAVDGSDVSIPRDPTADSFITTPSNPRGYNALHANILYDINNSVFVDCTMGRDEQGQLYSLIYRRKFHEPTIIVMDRGYESYNTVAHCCNIQNLFFVLRVKQGSVPPHDFSRILRKKQEQPKNGCPCDEFNLQNFSFWRRSAPPDGSHRTASAPTWSW